MALDLTGDFTRKVNFDPSEEIQPTEPPPQYSHTFAINDCVPEFTDQEGVEYPEMFAVYGYQLQFDNYGDLDAFESNPQFQEIKGTIIQMVSERLNDPAQGNGNISTLQLEVVRDNDSFYVEDEPLKTFTENTLLDIEVVTKDIIPIINETYELNIQSGTVLEDSIMAPDSCLYPPVPDDQASLESEDGQKLGGGSTGATDFTM